MQSFNTEALTQTVQSLMTGMNELRQEVEFLRQNVAEALDLVWARSRSNHERCTKRFRAYRKRLRGVESTLRSMTTMQPALHHQNKQQHQHQHQQQGNQQHDGSMTSAADGLSVSPMSLASPSSTPGGAADVAKRLARLVASRFHDDDGDDDDPVAARRRSAALKRNARQNSPQQSTSNRVGPGNNKNSNSQRDDHDDDDHAQLSPLSKLAPPQFAATLGADISYVSSGGAVVVRVPMGSSLDTSGVQVGDRIVEVDGHVLRSPQDVEWLLGRRAGGPQQPTPDDDIFGGGGGGVHRQVTSSSDAAAGSLVIAVVPAKKTRSRDAQQSFEHMRQSAIRLSLPMSPSPRKMTSPSLGTPRRA